MRRFAIGDIHGHLAALNQLLELVPATVDDELIFLGDFVDKGPEVNGLLERLIDLSKTRRAIFLRGNHEEVLLDAQSGRVSLECWGSLAGEDALGSYGDGPVEEAISLIPERHWEFLKHECRDFYETPDEIFVHAGIRPHLAPGDESREWLHWSNLPSARHLSGKTVVCGHTAQSSGRILDMECSICIDTGIANGGWLSCLCLQDLRYWQVSAEGDQRAGRLRKGTGS